VAPATSVTVVPGATPEQGTDPIAPERTPEVSDKVEVTPEIEALIDAAFAVAPSATYVVKVPPNTDVRAATDAFLMDGVRFEVQFVPDNTFTAQLKCFCSVVIADPASIGCPYSHEPGGRGTVRPGDRPATERANYSGTTATALISRISRGSVARRTISTDVLAGRWSPIASRIAAPIAPWFVAVSTV
jgi:hypothetical protein